MQTVVICNSCVRDIAPDAMFQQFVIDGEEVTVALLDASDSNFDSFFDSHSVLVRVKAFSCNFRDRGFLHLFHEQCKNLSGNQKYFFSPIGSEFVGEIVKVGENVSEFKVGERVMPDHSYPHKRDGKFGGVVTNFASQRLQMFSDSALIKVPENMSDDEAAIFSLAAQTAHSMVRRATLKQGDNVLVTSMSSNTSIASLEALKKHDVNVYAMSSKADEMSHLAAEFNIQKVFFPDEMIADNKQIPAFDVVLDPFVDLNIKRIFPHLNYNARYLFCGVCQQYHSYAPLENIDFETMQLYGECIVKNISLMGNCLGNTDDLQMTIEDYEKGKYKTHIDSVFTGKKILDFFKKSFIEDRFGKVVYRYE